MDITDPETIKQVILCSLFLMKRLWTSKRTTPRTNEPLNCMETVLTI